MAKKAGPAGPDLGREMAMARFALIAPAVQGTFDQATKAEYYRSVSAKLVRMPDGTERRFPEGTLMFWEWKYRHGGFDALVRGSRSDAGESRSITPAQARRFDELRAALPRANSVQIRNMMLGEGSLPEGGASERTFQRYAAAHPLGRGEAPAKERRAFEAPRSNDMWQADTLYGPFADCGGAAPSRAYLQMVVDDHSRLVVAARFWAADTAANFQRTLRAAVEVYGLPGKLYVDNGAAYANGQLTGVCARLGVALVHAPVRDGAAKGKIERLNQTCRTTFLDLLDPREALPLAELNDRLADWARAYNAREHSSTGQAPAERWAEGLRGAQPRRPASAEALADAFRNRESRKVRADATVTLAGAPYDAPAHLVGERVEVEWTPGDPSDVWAVDPEGARFRLSPTDRAANWRLPRRGGGLEWGDAR